MSYLGYGKLVIFRKLACDSKLVVIGVRTASDQIYSINATNRLQSAYIPPATKWHKCYKNRL